MIYLHGCAGIWSGTKRRIKFLADNGYLVIAPASFARKKYARSCSTKTHKGGMYRSVLSIRRNDAGFAIEQARKLAISDPERIALMGLSEGGITTAMFRPENDSQKIRARVIEGWTCHADWLEYEGLAATPEEPVLSLVAAKAPWFRAKYLRGHCGEFMDTSDGSKSIVYRKGKLSRRHELLEYSGPRSIVLKFLKQHL